MLDDDDVAGRVDGAGHMNVALSPSVESANVVLLLLVERAVFASGEIWIAGAAFVDDVERPPRSTYMSGKKNTPKGRARGFPASSTGGIGSSASSPSSRPYK